MDLKRVIAGLMGTLDDTSSQSNFSDGILTNTTTAAFTASEGMGKTQNPILDTLTPLLGVQFIPVLRTLTLLHQLFGARLGLEPTLVLTLVGAAWALNRLARQLYAAASAFVTSHLMCTVHVPNGDEIYTHMMTWLAAQNFMANSRSILAETVHKTAWEETDESEAPPVRRVTGGGRGKYLNFSNQQANVPPRFVPAVGLHGFWYNGRYFRLQRRQQSVLGNNGPNDMSFAKEESLAISCFGRSPEPIKKLLRTAKQHFHSGHVARTTIKRPISQMSRRYVGPNWTIVAVRPVRPLSTVVLDAVQKAAVLADMNEYLHPATPRWYADRGIPLRRGYLFWGPPGTGKTSLSFALAGVFGLDIYVISLLEQNMTEESLGALFSSLPRRCVVLLEDIDAAGLRRPDEVSEDSETEEEEEEEEEEDNSDDDQEDDTEKPVEQNGTNDNEERRTTEETNDTEGKTSKSAVNGTKAANSSAGTADERDAGAEVKATVKVKSRLSDNADKVGKNSQGKREKKTKKTNRARAAPRGRPSTAPISPWPRTSQQEENRGITLSGLLNAIDGVASQEGRVLVMTTNRPESLDEALIRPGRVDLQVAFSNATGEQAKELFERMYNVDVLGEESETETWGSLPPRGAQGKPKSFRDGPEKEVIAATEGEEDITDPEELSRVATEFGTKIPDGLLSPAEIQGFLLKRKKEPRRALKETDHWVRAMKLQKQSKSKVLKVQ